MLGIVSLEEIHIFESRKEAFRDDDVLQENIIWRGVRGAEPSSVKISTTDGSDAGSSSSLVVRSDEVVWPRDRERFIHIVQDRDSQAIAAAIRDLPCQLSDLAVEPSTGRVVDFRVKGHLRSLPEHDARPLIYPAHFDRGFVTWPVNSRKPNALALTESTRDQFVPNEVYVLLKRFTSKEEKRRLVAALYDPTRVAALGEHQGVGFENHLNYLHRSGRGLPLSFAKGLALFLNSTIADRFFRQFSGHTQVNARDLGMLRYPDSDQIRALGAHVGDVFPSQGEIDALVREVMPEGMLR